jgi:hypothetical protein
MNDGTLGWIALSVFGLAFFTAVYSIFKSNDDRVSSLVPFFPIAFPIMLYYLFFNKPTKEK